jgi:protein DEK
MENGENSAATVAEENLKKSEEEDAETHEAVKEEVTPAKVSSVRRKRKKKTDNDGNREPMTPTSERPSRERKSIERFSTTIEREKTKEVKIVKVCG